MSTVEAEIFSTPGILRQTLVRVAEERMGLAPLLRGPVAYLGCGSSHCVALAAAALYESIHAAPGQGLMASEYRPRAGWVHLAISRTGQTTELVEAMARARGGGALVSLICGAPEAPAAAQADAVLLLDFAAEQSVIQTRFISAALLALRLLIGGVEAAAVLEDLPQRVEAALQAFDPAPLLGFDQVVFLGRGWRYGLAVSAALNLQETALYSPNGYQTLEYRHGPLACANPDTLVWCFDPPGDAASAAVLMDVQRTGATVRCTEDDPLVSLALAQLAAVRHAKARGLDPDAPRHLSRAVVLPELSS